MRELDGPTIRLGELAVWTVGDGAANLGGWPSPVEPRGSTPVDWAVYAARYPDSFHGPEHRWRIHNNCFVVRSSDATLLVDCGVGPGPYPWYDNMRGVLPEALSGAGVEPGDIDTVFLTHAHPDHVGWTVDESRGVPRFPKARYVLHRKDWDEFRGRDRVPRHFTRFVQPLASGGVLDLLAGPKTIAPGVTAIETPGHTPGHMSLFLESEGAALLIGGDVFSNLIYVTEPERPFPPDLDIDLGIQTRLSVLRHLTAGGWMLASGHFPPPAIGRVVSERGRRWFSPVQNQW